MRGETSFIAPPPASARPKTFRAESAAAARRQPARGRAQPRDLAALPFEAEGCDDARDVLIKALANLIGRKLLARTEHGNADRGDDLACRERRLAITGDELFHRQYALARTRGERDRGIKRDQAWNGVPDRRSGREIARDGSEIADLPRADAAYEGTEGLEMPIEVGQGGGIGHGAADLEGAGLRLDPLQLLDDFDRNHRRQRLAILADAQPKIGAASKQDRSRELRRRRKQRIKRARPEKSLGAVTILHAWW